MNVYCVACSCVCWCVDGDSGESSSTFHAPSTHSTYEEVDMNTTNHYTNALSTPHHSQRDVNLVSHHTLSHTSSSHTRQVAFTLECEESESPIPPLDDDDEVMSVEYDGRSASYESTLFFSFMRGTQVSTDLMFYDDDDDRGTDEVASSSSSASSSMSGDSVHMYGSWSDDSGWSVNDGSASDGWQQSVSVVGSEDDNEEEEEEEEEGVDSHSSHEHQQATTTVHVNTHSFDGGADEDSNRVRTSCGYRVYAPIMHHLYPTNPTHQHVPPPTAPSTTVLLTPVSAASAPHIMMPPHTTHHSTLPSPTSVQVMMSSLPAAPSVMPPPSSSHSALSPSSVMEIAGSLYAMALSNSINTRNASIMPVHVTLPIHSATGVSTSTYPLDTYHVRDASTGVMKSVMRPAFMAEYLGFASAN